MTLGPDRKTLTRWALDNRTFEAAKDGGGGAGEQAKNDTPPKDDKPGDKKGDDKPGETPGDESKKDVVIEVEGRKFVLQDHVNELVGTARTEGAATAKAKLEQETRDAEAKKNGDYKTLYEQEIAKREQAERDLAETKLSNLRRSIGLKHGLSELLADRLRGDDEKAIEADAKQIAAEQGKKERPAPDTEAGKGSRSGNNKSPRGGDESKDKSKRPFAFQQSGDVKRW